MTSPSPAGGRPDAHGVGQPGFATRNGLCTAEQAAATQEVASKVRELDLATVRLVVVDQHGVPRAKSPDGVASTLEAIRER